MAEGERKDAEDRTEAPTPRRLERARAEGQVALSRDVTGFATLLAATLAAALALPALGLDLLRAMRAVLIAGPEAETGRLTLALAGKAALLLLPVLGATALAAVLATLAQTGLPRSAKPLKPSLARLNPLAALKRILGPQGAFELLRTLLKLLGVGWALWLAVDLTTLAAALHRPPGLLLRTASEGAMRLLVAALLAFAVLAALDLLWVRWRHLRQLRMTRQELREELKDTEGDPHLKARRRRLQEGRARQRMMAAVPKATVVITNPTHYAVALRYEQGQAAAPRLVAKGVDAMAARIRAVAEEHGVPIVSNPPLARALYRLEPDTEIPAEHWQAVAEIIAYVWRLRGQGAAPGHG
ncbi:EscU/YscU/HrcU family type III secretion system export apparatus switch protein [Crenalkalicoccus roseus]|uniref:EscU/YscU/HrcU family type III secretion system export apparatus switch protein n=1 Tax=Crenalkalicoccus roseus TaxID=1485588 RepID=UPI001081CF07|nr:EscU/YscU/HrcU family type III secretion system export apparatus switch protein [Crenalkalicoccus roseus]